MGPALACDALELGGQLNAVAEVIQNGLHGMCRRSCLVQVALAAHNRSCLVQVALAADNHSRAQGCVCSGTQCSFPRPPSPPSHVVCS